MRRTFRASFRTAGAVLLLSAALCADPNFIKLQVFRDWRDWLIIVAEPTQICTHRSAHVLRYRCAGPLEVDDCKL